MQTLWNSPFRKPALASAIATAFLASAALPLAAQTAPPLPRQQGMESEQDRRILNEEQARFARQQLDNNASASAEYDRALADLEATKARIAADDAAAQAAFEAEKARIEAEYASAMARWEADVAACRGGDFSRCAAN